MTLSPAAPWTDPTLPCTVEALAARAGVSVRSIRAWNTAGLLPPPTLQGRLGLYGDVHLQRLTAIRELRRQGFGIEAIRRIVARAPASDLQALVSAARAISAAPGSDETPLVLPAAAVAAKWHGQMTPERLARASRAGLMRALPGDQIELSSPALGRIAEQLAELGLPLEQVLQMQEAMARNLRTVARHWLRALADNLLGTEAVDTARLAQLLEQARPLASGAVQAAFPVILQQEFDARLSQRP